MTKNKNAGPKRDLDKPAAKKVGRKKARTVDKGICFVMMPFREPVDKYYEAIFEPAIKKADMTPLRADDSIFSTGKIMDQVWSGIEGANVLLAELSLQSRNVYYELGLAHALQKPVIIVAPEEDDVPFDLRHLRILYYDADDPFWGQELIDRIAENITSALSNPQDAVFKLGVR